MKAIERVEIAKAKMIELQDLLPGDKAEITLSEFNESDLPQIHAEFGGEKKGLVLGLMVIEITFPNGKIICQNW